jgi:hypothetical protein
MAATWTLPSLSAMPRSALDDRAESENYSTYLIIYLFLWFVQGDMVYIDQESQYGSYAHRAGVLGAHEFCLSNEFSTLSGKKVFIQLHV